MTHYPKFFLNKGKILQFKVQISGILEEKDSFYWPKMHLWIVGRDLPAPSFGQNPNEEQLFFHESIPKPCHAPCQDTFERTLVIRTVIFGHDEAGKLRFSISILKSCCGLRIIQSFHTLKTNSWCAFNCDAPQSPMLYETSTNLICDAPISVTLFVVPAPNV